MSKQLFVSQVRRTRGQIGEVGHVPVFLHREYTNALGWFGRLSVNECVGKRRFAVAVQLRLHPHFEKNCSMPKSD